MDRFYVGTYTSEGSEGLYTGAFDPSRGVIGDLVPAARVANPTFLVIHRPSKRLYSVGNDDGRGMVCGYRINPDSGMLTPFTRMPVAGGRDCFITVDAEARYVFTADYGGGTVRVLAADPDGQLQSVISSVQYTHASGVVSDRQSAPHAHSIVLGPLCGAVYAADLGGDRIYQYVFNPEAGELQPANPAYVETAPGAGPRHFAFHPDGRHAAVIHELNGSITIYEINPEDGTLQTGQTVSTLPNDFSGQNTTADIHFSPDGRFLYGSNRGHDSIAVYAFDAASAEARLLDLTPCGGQHPRNFALSPDGRFLLVANRDSDSIAVFTRNEESGLILDTGFRASVSRPVCVKWL